MVRLTYQHVIVRDRFALRGAPWYFGDFCNIFQPNIGEDQINVLRSERVVHGTVPYGKSGPGFCIIVIKKLDEGLKLQLLGQTLLILHRLYI